MNRTSRLLPLGVLTAALVVAAVPTLSQLSNAHETDLTAGQGVKSEVILMRCSPAKNGIPIEAYRGSPGTPGKKSEDCAENLSILMRNGFVIRDIGHYDDADAVFVLYPMVR
jgi:hypothetical protein